ncbi:hypothetical protein WOLCODRAFT_106469, partial [Wolfiporia cocos MD-104 SS10]
MFSRALILLALASASLALPATVKHSTATWCSGLGGGAFDTAQNFTLTAYDLASTPANSTGVPLVVGQNSSATDAEYKVLSTYESYPYNDFPNFSLISGALIPNPSKANASVSAADVAVAAGAEPSFMVSSSSGLPDPAQIYCAVADTDPDVGHAFPTLAVNGDTDNFHLCKTSGDANAQVNVVYKASSNSSGVYDYDSCYRVRLQLIGLN